MVAQKKSLDVYELNKDFTQVVSPIDGQVSRYYLTLGNLVNQDQTLLTTVVSLDPMYVYFDMDESTLLRMRKLIADGKVTVPADGHLPVLLGLQNEDGFPHEAMINFMDNQVNSTIGSIPMRGIFANPKLIPATKSLSAVKAKALAAERPSTAGVVDSKSRERKTPSAAGDKASSAENPSTAGVASTAQFDRLFSPGMFVRVQLPIGEPHKALLIIDRAIQSDQGLKYVYVLDAQNKVQTRSIKTGAFAARRPPRGGGGNQAGRLGRRGRDPASPARKWKSSRSPGRCRRLPGKPRHRRTGRPGQSIRKEIGCHPGPTSNRIRA